VRDLWLYTALASMFSIGVGLSFYGLISDLNKEKESLKDEVQYLRRVLIGRGCSDGFH